MEPFQSAYERGVALYDLKRYKLAAKELLNALSLNPNNFSTLNYLFWIQHHLKNALLADSYSLQMLNQYPDNVLSHYNRASYFLLIKNYNEAGTSFKNALAIDPNHLNGISQYAYTKYVLGEYEESLALANRALALDPQNTNSLNYKILVFTQQQLQNYETIDCVEQLLMLHPNDDYSHANLAYYYCAMQQKEKAVEHFKTALKINPDNTRARNGYKKIKSKEFTIHGVEVTEEERTNHWLMNVAAVFFFILLVIQLDSTKEFTFLLILFLSMIIFLLPRFIFYFYLKYWKQKKPFFYLFDNTFFSKRVYDEYFKSKMFGVYLNRKEEVLLLVIFILNLCMLYAGKWVAGLQTLYEKSISGFFETVLMLSIIILLGIAAPFGWFYLYLMLMGKKKG